MKIEKTDDIYVMLTNRYDDLIIAARHTKGCGRIRCASRAWEISLVIRSCFCETGSDNDKTWAGIGEEAYEIMMEVEHERRN